MKMFIQKQSMICMEISIYYVHVLHTVHYVSSIAESVLIVDGLVLSYFGMISVELFYLVWAW